MKNSLTLGDIGIRRFRAEDAQPLFAAARESAEELAAWMVWYHPDYSPADSATFIEQCEDDWRRVERYSFVIFDVEKGSFLGSVGLSHFETTHRFANLGYWVRTSCTQRGVASRAVRLAANYGLRELALNRIEIVVPTANFASVRVAQKVGANFEGVLRKRLVLRGGACDAALYSLVAEDLDQSDARSGQIAAERHFLDSCEVSLLMAR